VRLVVAGKWDLFQLTVKMMKWTQCVLEIWVPRSALERRVVRWDEVGPLLKETVEGTSSWMLLTLDLMKIEFQTWPPLRSVTFVHSQLGCEVLI
jgi:hypothetical protein